MIWARVSEILPYEDKMLVDPTISAMAADDLGPLLLTWFNFNLSMDK